MTTRNSINRRKNTERREFKPLFLVLRNVSCRTPLCTVKRENRDVRKSDCNGYQCNITSVFGKNQLFFGKMLSCVTLISISHVSDCCHRVTCNTSRVQEFLISKFLLPRRRTLASTTSDDVE